ncbi:MAG: TrmB family transcriptional regulator [Haloferacaceae archaeon]
MPAELATAEAKLVYLYVQAADGCTVDELYRDLGLPKLALFPVLDTLRERGLIDDGDVAGEFD